jgi:tetratricopeptide (TPR) repeat protein
LAANPRTEELRKRLARDPGSRLFAQLAEELRKAGELDEAIAVCREGLEKHPNYPSARMTLGRALVDRGELTEASQQFQEVLRSAPDNILAVRLHAECLEGLGEVEEALAQYQSALALGAGDAQLRERIAALEKRLAAPDVSSQGGASAPVGPAAGQAEAEPEGEPAPIPLVAADESFELETAHEAVRHETVAEGVDGGGVEATIPFQHREDAAEEAEPEAAPIPLATVEESFELESPHEAARGESAEPEPTGETVPMGSEVVEAAREAAADRGTPIPPVPRLSVPPRSSQGPAGSSTSARGKPSVAHLAPEHAAAAMAEVARRSETAPLTSVTLAELYVAQGAIDKAIEAYSLLAARQPGHPTAARRLSELRKLAEAQPLDPRAGRRAAIERTIERLEAFLAVVRQRAART